MSYRSEHWRHFPILFFGVGPKDRAGHYWHGPRGVRPFDHTHPVPERMRMAIDGTFAPGDSRASGRAVLHHVHGLTVVSFWDYSADDRGGCNGNFVVPGALSFEEVMSRAHEHFAGLLERIGPLTLVPTLEEAIA